jgi:hypothetical protein
MPRTIPDPDQATRPSMMPLVLLALLSLLSTGLVAGARPASAAGPMPSFQLPFTCGEVWHATTRAGHAAIDWNAYPGQVDDGRPVLASAAGTATTGYEAGGWGNYVTIDHGDGWQTRYAHLGAPGRSGPVQQGDEIGRVGSTGGSDAPHLHWEVVRDGTRLSSGWYAGGEEIRPGTSYTPSDPSYTSRNCPQTAPVEPFGSLDLVEANGDDIRVTGWTIDPDAPWIPNDVHVYVDGAHGTAATANLDRPDVEAAHPGYGRQRGYDVRIPFTAGGRHQVCAYGINYPGTLGANTLLACRDVVVPNPFGVVDSVTAANGEVRVQGWTIDADAPWLSNDVHVYVDDRGVAATANLDRPDVEAAYPGYGRLRGFDVRIPGVGPGNHQACSYAINVNGTQGHNTLLDCRTITV